MVNQIKDFIKEKTVLIFIILVLFGIFSNFMSAYEHIGPSIDITEEAPEEKGMLTEEDKKELLKIAYAFQDPYMAWRFGVFNYELVCIMLACCAMFYPCAKSIRNIDFIELNSIKRRKKYFWENYLINLCRGGLVVILPTIIATLVYFIIFKSTDFPSAIVEPSFPQNILSNLFTSNPFLYMAFYTAVLFFIGATYSTFALAITIYTNKILLGIILPFIYWVGGGFLLAASNYAPWNIFYFIVEDGISFGTSVIHTSIILLISSFAIYKKVVADNNSNLNNKGNVR